MKIGRERLMKFTRLAGPIAFTERDVDFLLEDDAEVEMFKYTTTDSGNRFDCLIDEIRELLIQDFRKAAFIITCNRNLQPPLPMDELVAFVEQINTLPQNRDILWAFLYDDSLPTDTLCLNVIIVR